MGLAFEASTAVGAPAEAVYDLVSDLATYPRWLGFVHRADAESDGDAWRVDIGARIGPFARAKRLRMRRTVEQPPSYVRFERAELDGRPHPEWVMQAWVEAGGQLRIALRYDGGMPLPGIELLLRQEVARAGDRLRALLRS